MSNDVSAVILSPEEIQSITGYRQPRAQLAELQRQGFWRARRSPLGSVIVERAHYEAICRGEGRESRPQVRISAPRPAVKVA